MDPQVLNLQQESPLPDSITCGQCSLKFYHVSLFLKHKSTCAGDSDNKKDAASDTGKCFEIYILENVNKQPISYFWVHFDEFLILILEQYVFLLDTCVQ